MNPTDQLPNKIETFSIELKQDSEFHNIIFKMFMILQSKIIQHVKKQEDLNSHGKRQQQMPALR